MVLAPDDLRVLMIRYQGGDLEAFDCLHAELLPRVRGWLGAMTRDASLTDDLVQETFLQLHRARRTYDGSSPVLPWVRGVARHVYLMDLRSRVRRGSHEAPPLDAEPPGDGPPDRAVIARDRVNRGLSALTPGSRLAVWMHHVQGWSFDEIGKRFGIRGSAAKLRAARGMSTLRKRLSDERKGDDAK